MDEKLKDLYSGVESYTAERNLTSAARALPWIRDTMLAGGRSEAAEIRFRGELTHCLEVCAMLMNLHLSIPQEEEDVLLAAVLLHIYPENFAAEELEEKVVKTLGLPRAVFEIVDTIIPERNLSDAEQQTFYERIQRNKLALLAALADRGNVVQQLHRYSTWNAHRYIDETQACYYPMCIYGKEHYHELLAPISVLMEKMRSLIEVAEVLLRRYEVREAELIRDILALREENATIKGIIAKFSAQ